VRKATSAIVIIRGRSSAIWKFASIPRPHAPISARLNHRSVSH